MSIFTQKVKIYSYEIPAGSPVVRADYELNISFDNVHGAYPGCNTLIDLPDAINKGDAILPVGRKDASDHFDTEEWLENTYGHHGYQWVEKTGVKPNWSNIEGFSIKQSEFNMAVGEDGVTTAKNSPMKLLKIVFADDEDKHISTPLYYGFRTVGAMSRINDGRLEYSYQYQLLHWFTDWALYDRIMRELSEELDLKLVRGTLPRYDITDDYEIAGWDYITQPWLAQYPGSFTLVPDKTYPKLDIYNNILFNTYTGNATGTYKHNVEFDYVEETIGVTNHVKLILTTEKKSYSNIQDFMSSLLINPTPITSTRNKYETFELEEGSTFNNFVVDNCHLEDTITIGNYTFYASQGTTDQGSTKFPSTAGWIYTNFVDTLVNDGSTSITSSEQESQWLNFVTNNYWNTIYAYKTAFPIEIDKNSDMYNLGVVAYTDGLTTLNSIAATNNYVHTGVINSIKSSGNEGSASYEYNETSPITISVSYTATSQISAIGDTTQELISFINSLDISSYNDNSSYTNFKVTISGTPQFYMKSNWGTSENFQSSFIPMGTYTKDNPLINYNGEKYVGFDPADSHGLANTVATITNNGKYYAWAPEHFEHGTAYEFNLAISFSYGDYKVVNDSYSDNGNYYGNIYTIDGLESLEDSRYYDKGFYNYAVINMGAFKNFLEQIIGASGTTIDATKAWAADSYNDMLNSIEQISVCRLHSNFKLDKIGTEVKGTTIDIDDLGMSFLLPIPPNEPGYLSKLFKDVWSRTYRYSSNNQITAANTIFFSNEQIGSLSSNFYSIIRIKQAPSFFLMGTTNKPSQSITLKDASGTEFTVNANIDRLFSYGTGLDTNIYQYGINKPYEGFTNIVARNIVENIETGNVDLYTYTVDGLLAGFPAITNSQHPFINNIELPTVNKLQTLWRNAKTDIPLKTFENEPLALSPKCSRNIYNVSSTAQLGIGMDLFDISALIDSWDNNSSAENNYYIEHNTYIDITHLYTIIDKTVTHKIDINDIYKNKNYPWTYYQDSLSINYLPVVPYALPTWLSYIDNSLANQQTSIYNNAASFNFSQTWLEKSTDLAYENAGKEMAANIFGTIGSSAIEGTILGGIGGVNPAGAAIGAGIGAVGGIASAITGYNARNESIGLGYQRTQEGNELDKEIQDNNTRLQAVTRGKTPDVKMTPSGGIYAMANDELNYNDYDYNQVQLWTLRDVDKSTLMEDINKFGYDIGKVMHYNDPDCNILWSYRTFDLSGRTEELRILINEKLDEYQKDPDFTFNGCPLSNLFYSEDWIEMFLKKISSGLRLYYVKGFNLQQDEYLTYNVEKDWFTEATA